MFLYLVAESNKESPTPLMQGPEDTHLLPSEGKREEEEPEESLVSFTIQMNREQLREDGDGKGMMFV